jgi:hypothetical protein
MTTDNFCGKLDALCKKFSSTLQRAFLPLLGGTGKKILALKLFHYPTDKSRRFVSRLSRKRAKKKRLSA